MPELSIRVVVTAVIALIVFIVIIIIFNIGASKVLTSFSNVIKQVISASKDLNINELLK